MYRQNWQKYRAARETLRHERYLFMACTGPYEKAAAEDPRRVLAQHVETLVAQEHTNWIAQLTEPDVAKPN